MNIKRLMGVALAFLLLFAICVNAFHTHADHFDDHSSISSAELEADCSLCNQLAPNGDRLDRKVFSPIPPPVEHETPLSPHPVQQTEVRPIATLMIAPKTSPPIQSNTSK